MTSIESLTHTLQLLREEKEEDLEQYKQKVLKTPLQERRRSGLAWYPVVLKRTLFGTGEKLIVEFERTSELNKPHVFQSGKLVNIFAQPGDGKISDEQISGVINQVKANRMMITLNSGNVPEWIDNGKIGIDLLFDEASYREMEFAIKQMISAKGRTLELREIILGDEMPVISTSSNFVSIPELNEGQNKALHHIFSAEDVAIVHGPPGTGKTTTLVHAISEVVEQEKQVLVCAPSNAAVDLLVEKLSVKGLEVVRLGHPARVTEEALQQTVDARIVNHPVYQDLKKIKQKKEELRKLAFKYKRHFGPSERNQRKLLLKEASTLQAEVEALEYYILEDILGSCQVVACTLVGASGNYLQKRRFSTLFIDEAAQALEPACWIPLMRSDRVILAGDHCQLPPTIKSLKAAKEGLAVTLFEKIITQKSIGVLLHLQYRMNEKIMGFSSSQFYKNALQAHPDVKGHTLAADEAPMEFIDTAGCAYTEQINPESLSRFNADEAKLLLNHLNTLIKKIGIAEDDQEEKTTVGIISPYKEQILYLNDLLPQFPALKAYKDSITIDTIDAFQGRERDVIYISLVRSNDSGEIGFLGEVRRINVAMTRARKKLVLIGDSATLGHNQFYSDLIDYVTEIEAYRSAFEFTEYM